jgi:membrane-associated phospholipid phosphatase
MLITNLLAFVAYEVYPVAPPRLTSGLIVNHHLFRFQDTMQHVIGSGKLNGVPIGYNAYSAMPSVHAAWALVIGLSVVWLARNPLLRVLGALYPGIMVFTIVVTGNHYLLDAIGGALAVAVAVLIALGIEHIRRESSSHGNGPYDDAAGPVSHEPSFAPQIGWELPVRYVLHNDSNPADTLGG